MNRGTEPSHRQHILSLEDTTKLKILLQYAFADSPTFEGLTEVERAILGDRETYVRLTSWACEGKVNPYVTGEAQHVTPSSIKEWAMKRQANYIEHQSTHVGRVNVPDCEFCMGETVPKSRPSGW